MKKLLATLLAAATAVSVCGGLAACGGDDGSKTLTVWAPSAAVNTYKSLASDWKAANADYKDWTVKVEAVEEDVVQDRIAKSPSTKADVFFFPSDHINSLMKKNILQKVPADSVYRANVEERDVPDVIDGAMKNGELMAFPATYDNGYFLYYDKNFYNKDEVETLDVLQAKARKSSKTILYDIGSGYYSASFFWSAGCSFGYTTDSMEVYETDVDNANGKAAALACFNYFNPGTDANGNGSEATVIIGGDVNTAMGDGFGNGSMVAGIGGTWAYANIREKMALAGKDPDSIGVAVLPKFKITLNGTEEWRTMTSFIGYKFCGVNAQRDSNHIKAGLSLADYFTSEAGQLKRFKDTNAGPSNKALNETAEVKDNPILKVFHKQAELAGEYQDPKGHPSSYWANTFIKDIMSGTITKGNLTESLEKWAADLRKG